jgi:hypothetical protein
MFEICLVAFSLTTSCTVGMRRTWWSVHLVIYHGAFTICLSIFDCCLWMMAAWDLLAQPHSSMPYVQMGLMTALYIRILFSVDKFDFLPMSQFKSVIFMTICCFIFGCFLSNVIYDPGVSLGT